jgi:adenylate cyclase
LRFIRYREALGPAMVQRLGDSPQRFFSLIATYGNSDSTIRLSVALTKLISLPGSRQGLENHMEAPPLERKLVAILAADVAGYSRLMGADEEGTLATLSAFRAITDMLIERHAGKICGTAGDSVLAAFASALGAVQCAVDIQEHLARANDDLATERRMWFRIGVNVGDVMVKEGDIFGDGVNIATRIEGLAEPGGICISRGVHDHVMRKLSYKFEDLGEKSVKNIAQPIRVFRLVFGAKAGPSAPNPEVAPLPDTIVLEIPSLPSSSADISPTDHSTELLFWDSVKDSVRSADFEAYLNQYPEGSFVALARVRLEACAAEGVVPSKHDHEVELLFWESVRLTASASQIQAYLDKFPDGSFKALAELQLADLEEQSRL